MKSTMVTVTGLAVLTLLTGTCAGGGAPANAIAADCPPCGPDLCLNDSRYPPKLAKKKADLKKAKFPDDLIALLDRDGKCVMAIDQAPDTFTILLVDKNGTDSKTIAWSQADEDLAKKKVLSGDLKEYYKYNARKAFACCGEPKAEGRPDWDTTLSLSRGMAIVCTKQGGVVVCK